MNGFFTTSTGEAWIPFPSFDNEKPEEMKQLRLFLKTTTLRGPIDAFAACAHSPPDSKAAGIIRDAEFKVAFFVRLTSSRPTNAESQNVQVK
jgi:hypothetical protein